MNSAKMLSNCEKTVPSTTRSNNKWTQSQIDDHNKEWMASSGGGNRVMEKPGEELLQQQQQALRCPRCDSSNTKFCYYNNYSLSQPRHFCKACKRYWTRGGTLRNVPVGGGCRKNKRVKRPNSSKSNNIDTTNVDSPSSSSTPSNNSNPPSQSQPQPLNNINNSLIYGSSDVMNLPFSTRFVNSNSSRFDLQPPPHLNALGIGFSSEILGGDDGYRNGFGSNNTFFPSYNSIFGGSSSTSSTSASMPSSTPVMASLLNSTLLQQKFISGGGMKGGGDPFHGMSLLGNNSEGGNGMVGSKEVKVEGLQSRLEWNNSDNNQMEHMGLSDPSSLYWNNNNTATALGGVTTWSDQPNIGPSVTSLI